MVEIKPHVGLITRAGRLLWQSPANIFCTLRRLLDRRIKRRSPGKSGKVMAVIMAVGVIALEFEFRRHLEL